jgi:hypothetical protein
MVYNLRSLVDPHTRAATCASLSQGSVPHQFILIEHGAQYAAIVQYGKACRGGFNHEVTAINIR